MALTKIKLDTMVTGNLPDANIPNNITISNAGTATALETARTIHGVSFDGTANIDLTEAIQDVVGGMVSSNTETNIAVTYDDTNGKLDFASTDTNTFRPITAGGNSLGSSETLAFTAGSNVTITESGGAVTIASTDTNTTYSVGDGGLTQNNFTDALKSKLDGIASSANNYSLPLSTSSARGGVKIGYAENGKNYPVELDSEKMYVNVPWTDTNTTYSVGDGGLTQNNFTNTLKSKLDGIESGATADQDLSGYAALSGATFTGNVTHGGNIQTATSTDYAVLHGIQGGLRILSSRSGDSGILWTNNSGSFRGQLYGDGSNYGFLNSHWGSWNLKKDLDGGLTIYDGGGNTNIGSTDEWGRIEFNSYGNGVYVYTTNGHFRVDGGDWCPYTTDSDVSLGNSSLRWNGVHTHEWARIYGGGGVYWNDYGWHLYPNTSGSLYVRSGSTSYCQLELNAGGTTRGMVYADSSNQVGFLTNSGSWNFRISGSSTYVYGDLLPNSDSGYHLGTSSNKWDEVHAGDWFRSHGNTGWYQQTHGGGWYMEDSTWIRAYGDKNIYNNTGQIRGGSFRDGASGSFYLTPNTSNAHRLQTNSGYLDLGPMNGSWCHFQTDRGQFYFGSKIYVDGEIWRYGSTTTTIRSNLNSSVFYIGENNYTYGNCRVSGSKNSYQGIVYDIHSDYPTVMFENSLGSGGIYYQGSDNKWAFFWHNGNDCAAIGQSTTSSSYKLYVHGNTYTTGSYSSSDIRLKQNIETIDSGIEKVMKMRGVYFDWNDELKEEKGEGRQTGVIAQELSMVLPEAVIHAEDRDEYSVDYSKITGVLIEAIKDLKNEINELKKGCCNGS